MVGKREAGDKKNGHNNIELFIVSNKDAVELDNSEAVWVFDGVLSGEDGSSGHAKKYLSKSKRTGLDDRDDN